jgi:hypothetical protein
MKITRIPAEKILKLRKRLPKKSIAKIAENAGYGRTWVSQVLNGHEYNEEIISEAVKFLKGSVQSTGSLNEDINSIISENESNYSSKPITGRPC